MSFDFRSPLDKLGVTLSGVEGSGHPEQRRGVNVRVLAASIACAAVGVGVYLAIRLLQPTGPTPERAAEVAATSDAPRAVEAPSAEAPASEPVRRSTRRAPPVEALSSSAPAVIEAAPEVGTLRIESDVPGAQVFIDRQFIGATPVTAENVKPGAHQLNVSAEGFEGIARSIDVEPGPRDVMVRFRDVRLDARLAVVHKHRMGSCTGQLVATAQGLRYETTDKDDRFDVGLGEVEAFQVDYQDKNLRVKVRKGKQYNFTDPDGVADRLFVFHRDVDKARQRLAKGEQPATN